MTPAPLLFDMDGLLLDTERVAMRAFCTLAEPLGFAVDAAEQVFLGLIGSSGTQTKERLTGILPEGTDIEGFSQRWSEGFTQITTQQGIPLRPFADRVIQALAEKGHKMAVVTSTRGAHARAQLDQVGLGSHFAHVIGGDEVPHNKPHPAPYLAGAAALGAAPEDCFAFEDSDTGTTSAHKAGCRVVQIPDLRPPDRALPDLGQLVASDLKEAARVTGLLA